MLFSEALKKSKLFTLPPKSVARRIKSKDVPHHQVLETTSASAHRRDWGLKFPVTDAGRKQVEFREFEDEFSTNGTSPYADFAERVRILDETGVPLFVSSYAQYNSLLAKHTPLDESSRAELRNRPLASIPNKKFKQMLRSARLEAPTQPQKQANSSFLSAISNAKISSVPVQWMSSGFGAVYAPKGVLHNLPTGASTDQRVTARYLHGNNNSKNVLLFGGFVSRQTGEKLPNERFAEVPVVVNEIDVNSSGALIVQAQQAPQVQKK